VSWKITLRFMMIKPDDWFCALLQKMRFDASAVENYNNVRATLFYFPKSNVGGYKVF
jgi:hypothetical protein